MEPFGKEHAAIYDNQFQNIAPVRDGLQLTVRLALSGLPENASLLCVGAGTGTEVLTLADAYPRWRFCLVEPATAMLDIARKRLNEAGLSDRCTFHEGYLDTLETGQTFDGATALLVSHFLTDAAERTRFFSGIADRLAPGGLLVSADLAADRGAPGFEALMDVWLSALSLCDMPADRAADYKKTFGHAFAAHAPAEVENMMQEAGFAPTTQIFQAMLIRAWTSRKS